jgi:hypothetical protein
MNCAMMRYEANINIWIMERFVLYVRSKSYATAIMAERIAMYQSSYQRMSRMYLADGFA